MSSKLLLPDHADYPAALAPLGSPPLFLRGRLPDRPGVAIVGSRCASAEALAFTHQLARELATAGFAIWSGGARGVDAAAHEGALDGGGPTVAVAGGGLARPYPPEHVDLYARIVAAEGALLSRFADDTAPRPQGFLQRNQVLAAMTALTVMVEAGYRSGARNTVAAARRLGRPVCVVPQAPWSDAGAGCALELVRGATAVASAADVLAVLHGEPPPREPKRTAADARRSTRRPARAPSAPPSQLALPDLTALDPVAASVLGALAERDEPAHLDELADRLDVAFSALQAAILRLTLLGLVAERGPGLVQAVRGR